MSAIWYQMIAGSARKQDKDLRNVIALMDIDYGSE
jgi:hypothetical protein